MDAADDIVLVHMVQEHEELTNPVDVPVLPALPPRGPVQGQGGGGERGGGGDDGLDAADDTVLVHTVQENDELPNPVDLPVLPTLTPRGPVQGQGGGGECGGGGDDGLDNGSGGGIGRSLVIDRIDSSLLGTGQDPGPSSLQSLLVGENVSRLGGRSFQLDTSLERVFGRGATMLAIEFEGGSKSSSSSDSSSDSEEGMSVSTPDREDVGKKRMRVGRDERFGDLSGISGVGDHQLSCSEGEISEDGLSDVKKPRLGPKDDLGEGDHSVEEQGVPPDDPGPHDGSEQLPPGKSS